MYAWVCARGRVRVTAATAVADHGQGHGRAADAQGLTGELTAAGDPRSHCIDSVHVCVVLHHPSVRVSVCIASIVAFIDILDCYVSDCVSKTGRSVASICKFSMYCM